MGFPSELNLLPDGRRIWMVQADDKDGNGWHWDKLLPGDDFDDVVLKEDREWGGESWISSASSRARIRDEFAPGDIIVCYQAVPRKAVLGYARVASEGYAREDGEVAAAFDIDWCRRTPPVEWVQMRDDDILRNCEKVKVKVGTVFRLSLPELHRLVDLIPCEQRERAALLDALRLKASTRSAGIAGPVGGSEDDELAAFEGEMRTLFVQHRSRERSLREEKLRDVLNRLGRLRCEVEYCGFDFNVAYGSLGSGFAHVHHKRPLAALRGPTKTTLADLAVVCPNCHAMIHRDGEARSLDEVSRAMHRRAAGRGG